MDIYKSTERILWDIKNEAVKKNVDILLIEDYLRDCIERAIESGISMQKTTQLHNEILHNRMNEEQAEKDRRISRYPS